MPTQVIESFRFGLDTRRDQLTSTPGTLLKLENAHINPGAMAEKRKGFFLSTNSFPPDTFGLEMIATGLVTFGDKAPGVNGSTSPLPTGVTYQQLTSPYAASGVHIASIPYSCNFNGNAFVITKWTDGRVICYYNSSIVVPSLAGIAGNVTPNSAQLAALSQQLAQQINLIKGWLADANVAATAKSDSAGYHETALNGSTLAMSPAGVHFTPVVKVISSAAGELGAQLTAAQLPTASFSGDQNYAGVAAIGASVGFTLNAGTNGTVDVAVGSLDLVNGTPVPFNTTLNQTAADIATAINNFTFISGYTATASAATVSVFAPTSLGAFTGNLTVTTTGNITTVGAAAGTGFRATLTPLGLNVLVTGTGASRTVKGTIAASTAGAVGAVTFTWRENNADGTAVTNPTGITISPSTSAAVVTFAKNLFANTSVTGYFQCDAFDTATHIITQFIVSLEFDNNL